MYRTQHSSVLFQVSLQVWMHPVIPNKQPNHNEITDKNNYVVQRCQQVEMLPESQTDQGENRAQRITGDEDHRNSHNRSKIKDVDVLRYEPQAEQYHRNDPACFEGTLHIV